MGIQYCRTTYNMRIFLLGCLLLVASGQEFNRGSQGDQYFQRTPNNNLVQVKYDGQGGRFLNNQGFDRNFNQNNQFSNTGRNFPNQVNQFNTLRNNQVNPSLRSNTFNNNQNQGIPFRSSFGNTFSNNQGNIPRSSQVNRFPSTQNRFSNNQPQINSRFNQQQNINNLNRNNNPSVLNVRYTGNSPSFSQQRQPGQSFFKSGENNNQFNRNQVSSDKPRFNSNRDKFTRLNSISSFRPGDSRPQSSFHNSGNQFFPNQNRFDSNNRYSDSQSQFRRNENNFRNSFNDFSTKRRQQQQPQYNSNQNTQQPSFNNNQFQNPNLVNVKYQSQGFGQNPSTQAFQIQNNNVNNPRNFNNNQNIKKSFNQQNQFQGSDNRKEISGYIESETSNQILGDIQSFTIPFSANLAEGIIDSEFSCNNNGQGFYADVSSNCNRFHVCTPVKSRVDQSVNQYKFTFQCGPGEYFDQQQMTCAVGSSSSCQNSRDFYSSSSDRSRNFFSSFFSPNSPTQYSSNNEPRGNMHNSCFLANSNRIITGL